MPKYIVSSDGPIHVREVNRPDMPDMPDWGRPDIGLPGEPEMPGTGLPPGRPGHPIYPVLPPRDQWPPLPPWLEPGVGLPIPPTIEHPIVPLPPDIDPPVGIWPPVRPEFPDLSDKSLALALIFVSRHKPVWAWVVIDHEEGKAAIKEAFDKAKQAIKDRLPAGGIAGRPPQTKP
jgi:hypothetical protein